MKMALWLCSASLPTLWCLAILGAPACNCQLLAPAPGWCCMCFQMAAARETSGKEADLSAELSRLRAELAAAAAEKGELEEALGLMEKNNSAQVAALQVRRLTSTLIATSCRLEHGLQAYAPVSSRRQLREGSGCKHCAVATACRPLPVHAAVVPWLTVLRLLLCFHRTLR